MVVDTSAVMALLLGEPAAERIDELLSTADTVRMSAATLVEWMIVVESRKGADGVIRAERLLRRFDVEIVDVAEPVARLAIDGWRRFGKGRHRAGLNYGDCFAYALAIENDEPLLYVGTDFAQTDVTSALTA